jgi:hypothetical protein
MGNFVFTNAKGKFVQWSTLSAGSDNMSLVLLKTSVLQADATLQDYVLLSTLLASNTEATFTSYARKILTTGFSITPNFTTNTMTVGLGTQTWLAAGGVANDAIGKLIVCYRPTSTSADSATIPMTGHDITATTTGSDLIVQIASNNLALAS